MLPVHKKFSKLIFLFLVSGSKFSRFAGNQGDAISRGFGQNFLPQCVRHSLARLLASLVFALLVLLLGGGITFAAAGERCCCFCCWCWGCCWCWWEKVSRGDLLPLSPSPYPPYVSSSHWGLCFSKTHSAHTLYFCSLLTLEAGERVFKRKPDFKLYSRSSILPPWHPAQPE